MNIDTLLTALEARYDSLPPRVRKAARFAAQEPTVIALSPLRSAAAKAGVSPTTFIRLATALEFQSYDDFREPFRESLRPGSARYSAAATQVTEQKGQTAFAALTERIGSALYAQIEEVFLPETQQDIEAAGEILFKSRRIYVLGLRSCFAAAFYFKYVSGTFHESVVLVEGQRGMLVDDILASGKEDALLVISFDPYPIDTVRLVDLAKSNGTSVVAITDNRLAPIAKGSEVTLVVPSANSSYYTSLVPTMALLEALISYILMKRGKIAVERIEKRFKSLETQGVYWADKS